MTTRESAMKDFRIVEEPFYLPISDEVKLFELAYENKLPLMLKGPTGCGKTRFLSYMASKLSLPLITVACHEDLTASDLVGRYLLDGSSTRWQDGPLSLAVKHGEGYDGCYPPADRRPPHPADRKTWHTSRSR